MAGEWDVPGLLALIPAPLLLGWFRYYAEEPWDAPAVAVHAFGKSRSRAGAVAGDDPEAIEAALDRALGTG